MPSKSNRLLYIFIFWTIQALCQQPDKLVYSEGLAPKKANNSKKHNGLYGFVNESGRYVIKPSFDAVNAGFNQGLAVAVKDSKVGVINSNGKTVVPFEYKDVASGFSKKLIAVQNLNGLWGFYNHKGKKVIDCQYNNFRFRDKNRIVAQKNGFWGLIKSNGENIVDHKYRELDVFPDGKHFSVIEYNQWALKDKRNKEKGEFAFDSLSPAGEGVLKYYMIGKYGLVDLDGNFITEYKFDSIGTEKSGLFVVQDWNKYGVIDKKGNVVLPSEFEKVIIDENGIRAAVRNKEGKLWWGLYSLSGSKLLSAIYPYLGEFGQGLVPAQAENGVWRYINLEGETVIPFNFSKVGPFENSLAKVTDYISGETVLIDKEGEVVVSSAEMPFYKSDLFWLDRYNNKIWRVSRNNYEDFQFINEKYIRVKKDGKSGLLTTDDQILVSCNYDYVSEPSEEGYIVVQEGNKWGVLDKKGKVVLSLTNKFDRVFSFNEGYARVLIKGRYGFIDPRGNVYISPQYPDAGNASDGMVAVKINTKWGFVNTDEDLKVQPYYDQVWPFVKGTAIVFVNGKYNLVNKEGKELHEPIAKLKVTSSGKYLLQRNGKYGLADTNGKELLAVKYDMIKEVEGGYFIVNLRGLYGVIDSDNNIVIPITYNHIQFDAFNQLFICGSEKGHHQIKIDTKGREQ